jgi:biopolymer transport protein ExbD
MKIHIDAPAEEVQIQIIPLIDVIFCILTFFILAALQFTRQQAISVDLPKATTGTTLPNYGGLGGNNQFRQMLVVTISNTGQLFVDQKPVDRALLLQSLQTYIVQNPNGTLVLNASPNAFYNDVIQVIDLMRSVGGDRVALATNPTTPKAPDATSPIPGISPSGLSPSSPASPFDPTPTLAPSPFDPFATPAPSSTATPVPTAPGQ